MFNAANGSLCPVSGKIWRQQTCIHIHSNADTQIQTDRQTHIQTDTQHTDRQTDRHTHHTNTQTYEHTHNTDRQTDRHTHTQTYEHTHNTHTQIDTVGSVNYTIITGKLINEETTTQ